MTDDALRFWFQYIHQRQTQPFSLTGHERVTDPALFYKFMDEVFAGVLPAIYLKQARAHVKSLARLDPTR